MDHGTTTTTQADAPAHQHGAVPQDPAQGEAPAAAMTDEAQAAWHRLIELTGVDGKGGTIAAMQFEHARSAASQGARIGEAETQHRALEQRVDVLELARERDLAVSRGSRRWWAALGSVGLLAIGSVFGALASYLLGG